MSEAENTKFALTQYAHGAGCGCKIAPLVLQEILHSDVRQKTHPGLLVGNASNDDAAVYDLGNGTALISTADFFMPVVDDAYDFGRVAAANAISDVYAMGGKPNLALAILGWPVGKLPPALAKRVMEGARAICAEAGIPLAGGHSIDTLEPMFGLSVNGIVQLSRLKKNNTAKEGDVLFLTKPIGTGILSTAQKRHLLEEEDRIPLLQQLCSLNSIGEQLGKINGVHAMTDVTGFGLLGHLMEMAEGSQLSARLFYSKVPKLPHLDKYIQLGTIPDATFRNWNAYQSKLLVEQSLNMSEIFSVLPDPQTNGGLLFSVSPDAVHEVSALMQTQGLNAMTKSIGTMIKKEEKVILLEN